MEFIELVDTLLSDATKTFHPDGSTPTLSVVWLLSDIAVGWLQQW